MSQMPHSDLERTLLPLVGRLVAAAAADPGLRDALRAAANQLLVALADAPAATVPASDLAENSGAAAAGGRADAAEAQSSAVAAPSAATGVGTNGALLTVPAPFPMVGPRIILAASRDDARPPGWLDRGPSDRNGAPDRNDSTDRNGTADRGLADRDGDEVTDADLPLVEARCRMKADGCRWAATRRRRLAAGADFRTDVEPTDREIIERAKKLPDCFLWMNHPGVPAPADVAVLDTAASCFDVAADALAVTRAAAGDPDAPADQAEQAMALLAEAQSALRDAVARAGYGPDKDQLRAYHWLRGACRARHVYVARHMRADDPASPDAWPDLARRVREQDARAKDRGQRVRRRRAGLKRVEYHLKPILAGGEGDDRRHDWQVVVDTVDQLVADGLPPSSVELRDLLLPVADRLPTPDGGPIDARGPNAELPAGFRLTMREIDRYLADRPAPDPDVPPTPEQTDAVREVAERLAGRTVVMIGGVPRPHARRALEQAFGLAELDWVGTREHESIAPFEPHVARENVAVVLLAIRWSSHSFEGVKAFCDRHDKPLVRLPGGYHPNQVAVQILRQAGGRLGD
jgi:hypothetical protein